VVEKSGNVRDIPDFEKIINIGNFITGNATAAGINLQIDLSAIFKCLIAP
jgi:hypothetical protein